MTAAKFITIQMTDASGAVLGVVCIPSTARLVDLNYLRHLGAKRLTVRKKETTAGR